MKRYSIIKGTCGDPRAVEDEHGDFILHDDPAIAELVRAATYAESVMDGYMQTHSEHSRGFDIAQPQLRAALDGLRGEA